MIGTIRIDGMLHDDKWGVILSGETIGEKDGDEE